MGVPYTHGRWKVKEGREDGFVALWQDFAAAAMERGATGIRLLQDGDSPTNFYSFGSWESADQVVAFRMSPDFERHVAGMQELIESFEPLICESRLELGEMG